jgi:hypothetical protein
VPDFACYAFYGGDESPTVTVESPEAGEGACRSSSQGVFICEQIRTVRLAVVVSHLRHSLELNECREFSLHPPCKQKTVSWATMLMLCDGQRTISVSMDNVHAHVNFPNESSHRAES